MSTENTNTNAASVAPPAPGSQAATAAPPAAQQSAKPKYEVDYDPNNPPWLNDRLERERKTAAKEAEVAARKAQLAELGFDDIEVAKKLAADEKKRQEERKSLETKVAERDATLKAKEDRNRELEESVKSYAEGQLAGLTDVQRAAVIAVAGSDPPKQLKAIEALRPTWMTVPPVSPPNAQAASPANGSGSLAQVPPSPIAAAKPATATAPAPSAPPPAGAPVVPNHLETYERLNDRSSQDYRPFAAGAYYLAHSKEIEAARQARGSN